MLLLHAGGCSLGRRVPRPAPAAGGCSEGPGQGGACGGVQNDPTAHPTQMLRAFFRLLCLRACLSSPCRSSFWLDGYSDCQIQEEKAHNIHKRAVTLAAFALRHGGSDLHVGAGAPLCFLMAEGSEMPQVAVYRTSIQCIEQRGWNLGDGKDASQCTL